jgi:hypothetical protein
MRVASDMFVVGGANNSHGVCRAWLEGKVAGLTAALDLGHGGTQEKAERNDSMKLLSISK